MNKINILLLKKIGPIIFLHKIIGIRLFQGFLYLVERVFKVEKGMKIRDVNGKFLRP